MVVVRQCSSCWVCVLGLEEGASIEDFIGSRYGLGKGELASSGIAPRLLGASCMDPWYLVNVEKI